ncbi:Protein of unknown function [Gryllus bimaculatus]|nr:Protein of unknown function [Gryllus bimaculatus]
MESEDENEERRERVRSRSRTRAEEGENEIVGGENESREGRERERSRVRTRTKKGDIESEGRREREQRARKKVEEGKNESGGGREGVGGWGLEPGRGGGRDRAWRGLPGPGPGHEGTRAVAGGITGCSGLWRRSIRRAAPRRATRGRQLGVGLWARRSLYSPLAFGCGERFRRWAADCARLCYFLGQKRLLQNYDEEIAHDNIRQKWKIEKVATALTYLTGNIIKPWQREVEIKTALYAGGSAVPPTPRWRELARGSGGAGAANRPTLQRSSGARLHSRKRLFAYAPGVAEGSSKRSPQGSNWIEYFIYDFNYKE